MNATCGANDGTVMMWLKSVTKTPPMPTPKMAVITGKPIARSDPNAMKRMTIAANKPMSSAGPCGGASARVTTSPPSSICSPSTLIALTASINGWAAAAGRSPACPSNCTVPYATEPSGLIRPNPL